MLRKLLLIFTALLMVLSAGVFFAQDDEDEEELPQAYLVDGRLNQFDVAAPVAIYYSREAVPAENFWKDGYKEVITGVILYEVRVGGVGQPVLSVTKDEIKAAVASGIMTFDTGKYTLSMDLNGNFYVTSIPDNEGKVYQFTWNDQGRIL